MAPKAPKAPVTCNWVKSIVTESTLSEFVKSGYLPKKEVMSYRAPDPSMEKPQPKEGEVIIFTNHMSRGFAPPGSRHRAQFRVKYLQLPSLLRGVPWRRAQ